MRTSFKHSAVVGLLALALVGPPAVSHIANARLVGQEVAVPDGAKLERMTVPSSFWMAPSWR